MYAISINLDLFPTLCMSIREIVELLDRISYGTIYYYAYNRWRAKHEANEANASGGTFQGRQNCERSEQENLA